MSDMVVNGTAVVTPAEQRLLDKLRHLPPQAAERVEDYLVLLAAHYADPIIPGESLAINPAELLASEDFRRTVRHLPPVEAERILEYAVFVAGRCSKWSYSDPESMKRSLDLMGLDPFLLRESQAITRDFECTLADGLEDV